MIRKIITILCISFLAFSHSVLNASAFETNPTRIYAKEELENGYYLETVITTNYTQARSSIRNGTKTATYRDINGKALWSITVMGNSHIMENQQHVLAQHIVKPIIQQAGN